MLINEPIVGINKVHINPMLPEADMEYVPDMLGLLPAFFSTGNPIPWDIQLENGYGFPVTWFSEGNFDKEKGTFHFSEDPPLQHIASSERQTPAGVEKLWFMPYGLVIHETADQWKWTRMD